MIKVRTEVEIEAPIDIVWQILTDFRRYEEWNPFIRQIEGPLKVGQKLRVVLGNPARGEAGGMAFRPKVVKVENGRAFHWLGRTLVPGLMDGEHIFALEAVDEKTTRFIHGEDYRGLLVRLFGRFVPDDGHPNYVAMNNALKEFAESVYMGTISQT